MASLPQVARSAVLGSPVVQVLGAGQPLVFGPDCQILGQYSKARVEVWPIYPLPGLV